MSETLKINIEAQNSTGKGWNDVEREAKRRRDRVRAIVESESGFMSNAGHSTASELRGWKHISHGFREMLEGDILQGGATIARGLQHSLGLTFGRVATNAVGVMGAAFAGWEIGRWIEEKFHPGKTLVDSLLGKDDEANKSWDDTADKIKEAKLALDSYIESQDKMIRATVEHNNDALRLVNHQTTHDIRMIDLEERKATIEGDVGAPRREGARMFVAKSDALDKEEEILKRQKDVLETSRAEAFRQRDDATREFRDYSSSVMARTGAAGIMGASDSEKQILSVLASKQENASQLAETWDSKHGKTLIDVQDRLNAIPGMRDENRAELALSAAEASKNTADRLKQEAEKRHHDEITGQRERIRALEEELGDERDKSRRREESDDFRRQGLQSLITPPKPVLPPWIGGPVPGIFDAVPDLDAFGNASRLIGMGMDHHAMGGAKAAARRAKHDRDRYNKRLNQARQNGLRRDVTDSEYALITGDMKRRQAEKAALAMADIDRKAKEAAIKSREHLHDILDEIRKENGKLLQLLTMGGGS